MDRLKWRQMVESLSGEFRSRLPIDMVKAGLARSEEVFLEDQGQALTN